MDETLRLALVNHAIGAGADSVAAWPLVDRVVAAAETTDVRELAEAVWRETARAAWGTAVPRGAL